LQKYNLARAKAGGRGASAPPGRPSRSGVSAAARVLRVRGPSSRPELTNGPPSERARSVAPPLVPLSGPSAPVVTTTERAPSQPARARPVARAGAGAAKAVVPGGRSKRPRGRRGPERGAWRPSRPLLRRGRPRPARPATRLRGAEPPRHRPRWGAIHVIGGERGLILRVLESGQLDPSFGQDGVAAHGPDGFYVSDAGPRRSLGVLTRALGAAEGQEHAKGAKGSKSEGRTGRCAGKGATPP
jgi:hypothetical protein